MTALGTGAGGTVGGPPTPFPYETTTTAAAEINKRAMGIVGDTISRIISFVETNPRYVSGYLGGFGYKAEPSRANLPSPVETYRLGRDTPLAAPATWEDLYNEMASNLPQNLRNRLYAQKDLPLDQRDPTLSAADNLFTGASKTFMQLLSAAGSAGENQPTSLQTQHNLALPLIALFGSVNNGSNVTQALQSFLKDVGPNHPHFDTLSNASNQMQLALNLLQQVATALTTENQKQSGSDIQTMAAAASKLLLSLNNQLSSVDFGPDMKILQYSTSALQLSATALSLPFAASGGLYIALSTALSGINRTQDNPLGIVGRSLSGLINMTTDGLTSTLLPKGSDASRSFVNVGTNAALLSLISLASLIAQGAIGDLPGVSGSESVRSQQLTFASTLTMAANAGALQGFYESLIESAGGSPSAQQQGGSALAQLSHLIAIASATNGDQDKAADLVSDIRPQLFQGVQNADQINESTKSDQTASVALQQAAIALDKGQYDAFLGVMGSWYESEGHTLESLKSDLAMFNRSTASAVQSMIMASDNDQITTTMNVV